jgi:hypothetical protein
MKSDDAIKGEDYFMLWAKANGALYGIGCLFDSSQNIAAIRLK